MNDHIEASLKPFRITITGVFDENWREWLDLAEIQVKNCEDGITQTILLSKVIDQTALRGLLAKLWDLNLNIISVVRIEAD